MQKPIDDSSFSWHKQSGLNSIKPPAGRFAPTPSGGLHMGSLTTALYSYISIKRQRGLWILRVDDGDTPRVKHGAEDMIKRQLESLGLNWDSCFYQSHRVGYYQKARDALIAQRHTYFCECRRHQHSQACPCWTKHLSEHSTKALKISLPSNGAVMLRDRRWGSREVNLLEEGGDFLIQRRDGLMAYQLMSAFDDAPGNFEGAMGITEVVRGMDLWTSSARQSMLQMILFGQSATFAHLPLLVDGEGKKLSKSTQSMPIDVTQPERALMVALMLLGQTLPKDWQRSLPRVETILQWAMEFWQEENVPRLMQLSAPINACANETTLSPLRR